MDNNWIIGWNLLRQIHENNKEGNNNGGNKK